MLSWFQKSTQSNLPKENEFLNYWLVYSDYPVGGTPSLCFTLNYSEEVGDAVFPLICTEIAAAAFDLAAAYEPPNDVFRLGLLLRHRAVLLQNTKSPIGQKKKPIICEPAPIFVQSRTALTETLTDFLADYHLLNSKSFELFSLPKNDASVDISKALCTARPVYILYEEMSDELTLAFDKTLDPQFMIALIEQICEKHKRKLHSVAM